MNEAPEDIGPSRVQGCLYVAVGLFVVLLLVLLVIAFLRFEEFTGEDARPLTATETPALVPEGLSNHFTTPTGPAPTIRSS